MTGRAPARFRIHTALNVHWAANAAEGQANFLEPSVPTVTKLLQGAGWRTGHFGKVRRHPSHPALQAHSRSEGVTRELHRFESQHVSC